jgi:uncharacterized protein (TIGR00290 family)
MKNKLIFSWSGGKDSALALYEVYKAEKYEIMTLLTTVTEDYNRISMHGVRRELLEEQAGSMELPLEIILLSVNAGNGEYERKMEDFLVKYKDKGTSHVCFGDIFLEDLKDYREANLQKVQMKGIYPIWKRDSNELAQTFIREGFKAIITCVDSEVLDKKFAGRLYDQQFLDELPAGVDPCGENGEFHSFVFDGPIFKHRINVEKGDVVVRDNRFYYCDLIPV